MNDWPDNKIFNNAIWDIRSHSMSPDDWKFTRIADYHECIVQHVDVASGELPVVTAKTSPINWYALTSRRIIGETDGTPFCVASDRMTRCDFGKNPKGYNDVETDVAMIEHLDGDSVVMEFETGHAWMAPEYYISWWVRKYVILDILKFDPNTKTTA